MHFYIHIKLTKMPTSTINKVNIRLYRAGTGDCFLLQFKAGNTVKCKMMIDCGCIQGARGDFEPWLKDIRKETGGKIDILVVTHQHEDHINGFKRCPDLFDKFTFKKVWFAWTEDESDAFANDLRQNHSKTSMAIQAATTKLQGLVKNKFFNSLYKDEVGSEFMVKGQEHFVNVVSNLNSLNTNNVLGANGKIPSMVALFKDFKVIKPNTKVEFFNPGDLMKDLSELPGMRIFVLGPPRDTDKLDIESAKGENFDKREKPSKKDAAFAAAVLGNSDGTDLLPFETIYELNEKKSPLKDAYLDAKDKWRTIDTDWLLSSGSMALRYEGSINNTSLALAFQFIGSERVLLFPADAEVGNWTSWHEGLSWTIKINGVNKKVNAEYILNNTVFYKIGHHCSQNGSASRLGVNMMTSDDLTAMAPLNFKRIQPNWLNTMPNDILCATLIDKTKGKLYFSGNKDELMKNIKTKRVTIKKSHEDVLNKLNDDFDGEIFVECEVKG